MKTSDVAIIPARKTRNFTGGDVQSLLLGISKLESVRRVMICNAKPYSSG